MQFTLTINLDNDEAQDGDDYMLPEYLAQVAGHVRDGLSWALVMDGNGNTIGEFQISGYK